MAGSGVLGIVGGVSAAHASPNVDSFSGAAIGGGGGGASFLDFDDGIRLIRLSGVLGDGKGEMLDWAVTTCGEPPSLLFRDPPWVRAADVATSAMAFPAAS